MKKLFFIILFLAVRISSYAQLSSIAFNQKKYDNFKNNITCVVKTGRNEFDQELANVLKEKWKISKYTFITGDEFEVRIKEKSTTFLLFSNFGLVLINGGYPNITYYGIYDMFAFCPLNNIINEKYPSDIQYRLRNMIESMVRSLELIEENKLKGNMISELTKKYNENSPSIKNKTLLFCLENMGPNITLNDLKDNYPYKFEVVTKEKLAQIIKDKNPNYLYFHHMFSDTYKYIFVFDPVNGEVLFASYSMNPMGLVSISNIKDLTKKIEGK